MDSAGGILNPRLSSLSATQFHLQDVYWLPRSKVSPFQSLPCHFMSLTDFYSNSLAINAANIIWAFQICKAKDALGNEITPDPDALLDEGLAV